MTDKAQGAEREQFEAWFGKPLMNPAYPSHFNGKHARKQWEAWQAGRSALKAQPAPTEAQGEDSARLEHSVGFFGHMDIYGNWSPNHRLTMTPAEQAAHNARLEKP